MRAGELRNRIRIEQRTDAADGYGGLDTTWTVLDVVPAKIEPAGAGEGAENGRQMPKNRHKVTMRYRTGVLPAMRVISNGRALEIESVVNVEERNRTLELMCVERVGEDTN